ncbi:progressive ankylosis protein homolog [Branchiostoma lanceolatum]|uniref:progressive ankylosis protein homolog n=1 Tax=Branchiostoma lanceolatum TaxID=7740 RepID=UPI00345437FC
MGDYWRLAKFMVPLACTTIATDIGEQALNRGVAFSENVTASYGLAFSLTKFLGGSMQQTRHIGLILVQEPADGRRAVALTAAMGLVVAVVHLLIGNGRSQTADGRRAVALTAAMGLVVAVVHLLIALTPLGYLLIERAHQVDSVVGAGSRRAMLFLGAFPLLDGLAYVFIGMLLQYHHALVVGASSIADVCVQVAVSLALMETALQTDDPLLIPILALYAAMAVRLAVIVAGFLYKVRPKIRQALPLADKESFTVLRALKFWWPLALVTAVNRVSRPIVNLLVARDLAGSDAVEAVAVLTVTYPIGHLPYAWLNEMKSLAPAFRKSGQGRRVVPWRTLGKFSLICLLLVLTVSLVLFFVPGITFAIMTGWIQTSADIARLCRKPLQIFTFIAVPVSIRAYLTSWLMVQKRTWILTPSAVLRTVALVTALLVLPKFHIRGADMGIAALLTGFLVEASVVAVGFIIVRRRLRNRARPPDGTTAEAEGASSEDHDDVIRPMLVEKETAL